ncbi:MAG: respiratory nitrate reductase subunit gamma [Syntrophaceae bacterium]|nr:respiratory nitrate reductase subunit gamma [Syntrophaceae bacterium]
MDKHLIFYVMFFPTVIFFLWGMSLHISVWLEGTLQGAEKATKWEKFKIYLRRGWRGFWGRPGWYIQILITEVIFHRKLFSKSFYRWLAHTLLVFGFVATFIVDMIKGFTTGYLVEFGVSFAHVFETGAIRPFLDFFLEFFSFLILVGCVMAIVRRFIIRPDQLRTEEEDITSLLFILFLELSGFFIAGYRIAHPEVSQARIYLANLTPPSANNWISFASYFLSQFLGDIKINANFLWYFHVVPSLLFFIYLPHSKLLHIFTSSVTVVADRQKEFNRK